jgi:hypothetical protein
MKFLKNQKNNITFAKQSVSIQNMKTKGPYPEGWNDMYRFPSK